MSAHLAVPTDMVEFNSSHKVLVYIKVLAYI